MRTNFHPESALRCNNADHGKLRPSKQDHGNARVVPMRACKAQVFEQGGDDLMTHRVSRYQKVQLR
jgi:hypothetical protein